MERDYFKNIIKKDLDAYGNSLYSQNAQYIQSQIKNNTEYIISTNLSNLYKGSFYFIYYDLHGKTSNMEKFNPVLMIDQFDFKGIPKYYTLNINFLPIIVRTLFFNTLLNHNLDIIEKNKDVMPLKQIPLTGVSLNNIYTMLKRIGFEWAIRELEPNKINKIYRISTDILSSFITMSTATFTKVDDAKLLQIWQSKIKKQDIREQEMIKRIIESFENMSNDFETQYKTLDETMENIEKSLQIIKIMNA